MGPAADTGCMSTSPSEPSDNLFRLVLADGLPATSGDRELRYRVVHLRETNVADERAAQRQAERVVPVGGQPRLVVSDADFRFAMTVRHIAAFECDGQRIDQALIDLDMVGRLSSHDLGLIEARIFLIELAAEVRYGNLSEADFNAILAGTKAAPTAAPQPVGQAAGLGQVGPEPEPGPALLADYVGDTAHGTPAGHGG